MPRRSTREKANVCEVEKRVTRSRAGGSGDATKAEEPAPTKSPRGRGATAKSPSRGRGKGRNKKNDEPEVNMKEEEEIIQEPEKEIAKSSKSSSGRSPRGRGRKATLKEDKEEEMEVMEEPKESRKGRKRKHDDKEEETHQSKTMEKKKQKTEQEPKDMAEDIEKSYVLVNKDEIPEADSDEIKNSIPVASKGQVSLKPSQEQMQVAERPSPEKMQVAVKPGPEKMQVAEKPGPEKMQVAEKPTSKQMQVVPSSPPISDDAAQKSETGATDKCTAGIGNISHTPSTNVQGIQAIGQNNQTTSKSVTNSTPLQPSTNGHTTSNNVHSQHLAALNSDHDFLLNRHFVLNPSVDQNTLTSSKMFTVVSYNILADCHTFKEKYFWVSPEHLSQSFRHKRLMDELLYLDADVVCLQEVGASYFDTTLLPALSRCGYDGSFISRIHDMTEGEATFYKKCKFTKVTEKKLILRDLAFKNRELTSSGMEEEKKQAVKKFVDQSSVLLISQLRENSSGTVLTVGNIHVSWANLTKPDLQCIEVACAMKELMSTTDGPKKAHIICGDFNAWPEGPVYQLAKEGYLNDESTNALQNICNVPMPDGSKAALVNLWWKGFQHTANNLKDAYRTVLGEKVSPTTRYPHNGSQKEVDFVWFGGDSLEVVGALQVPPSELLSKPGIPNKHFPSDHLSLKVQLYFK